MSQLRQQNASHRCQIDCTNHDEVINALESKSKDLYYFWRNYEWLYKQNENLQQVLRKKELEEEHRSKPQPINVVEDHDKCYRQIEGLQSQNQKLVRDNKKLKLQLQICMKQLANQQKNNPQELQYKKELNLLRNKCSEYENVIQKYLSQINKLKRTIKDSQAEFDDQKSALQKQNKKKIQTIVDLQQTIDQLRNRPLPIHNIQPQQHHQPQQPQGVSRLQLEEYNRKQMQFVTSKMRNLQQQAQRLVSSEYDSLNSQLQQKLQEMLLNLTQRQLLTAIFSVQQ